jgi:hypothetical protein
MAPPKKRLGVGAVVSSLARFVHPSEHIRKAFPNLDYKYRLKDCVVRRMEVKKVCTKEQLCVVVTHVDFKSDDESLVELYAVKSHWTVHKEGDPDLVFDGIVVPVHAQAADEEVLMPPEFNDPEILDEAIIQSVADVVEIDDDNQPLPENIPTINDDMTNILCENWGHEGICFRRQADLGHGKAQLRFHVDPTEGFVLLKIFEGLFPVSHIEHVILPQINKTKEFEKQPLTYGEFLRWMGIWLIMSTVDGSDRRSFWSTKNLDMFEGAPFRLNELMSRNRFENILSAIVYTDHNPPPYKDRFWEVRQMLDAWNNNMNARFVPSWINVIDESMSKWVGQFTCPGFMYVPRKPWPFGNEYHDAGCCESNVIWQVDLREGKDRPTEAGSKEYDELGKTTGTLMRLTKPVHGTGKLFVLDSGFCVLEALVQMRKVGVFAHALVKKRRYWPKHVPGDLIIAHFADKVIGEADAIKGYLQGVPFYLFGMKEPDYTMIIMATYGTLRELGPDKTRRYKMNNEKMVTTFKYPEVVHNHYAFRDMIDNHNSQRMHPISLEETWMTTRWPNRVFSFLFAVTVVNVQNAATHFFAKPKIDALAAKKQLARDLIYNPYLEEPENRPGGSKRPRRILPAHEQLTLPNFQIFKNGILSPSKSQYQKQKCSKCNNRCRTYCSCSPGMILCSVHFAKHCVDVALGSS